MAYVIKIVLLFVIQAISFFVWGIQALLLAFDLLGRSILNFVIDNFIYNIGLNLIFDVLKDSGIVLVFIAIGIASAIISMYLDLFNIKISDLFKVLKYGVVAIVLVKYGVVLFTTTERMRHDVANYLYSSLMSRWIEYDSPEYSLPSQIDPQFFNKWSYRLRDVDNDGVYTIYDVAYSGLYLSNINELFDSSMPDELREQYYPEGFLESIEASNINNVLGLSFTALLRLIFNFLVTFSALANTLVYAAFNLFAVIILLSIPISLLFAFFLPTEVVFTNALMKYVYLWKDYLIYTIISGIVMTFILFISELHNFFATLIMCFISLQLSRLFVFGAWKMFLAGFEMPGNIVTGSINSPEIRQSDPYRRDVQTIEQTYKKAMGAAKGLAGLAVASAVGVPQLAPLLGVEDEPDDLDPSQKTAELLKGMVRVGLGYAGGRMVSGSSVAGAVQTFRRLKREGIDPDEIPYLIDAEDAFLTGLTSRDPVASFLILGRSIQEKRKKGKQDNLPVDLDADLNGSSVPDNSDAVLKTVASRLTPLTVPENAYNIIAGKRELSQAADDLVQKGVIPMIINAIAESIVSMANNGVPMRTILNTIKSEQAIEKITNMVKASVPDISDEIIESVTQRVVDYALTPPNVEITRNKLLDIMVKHIQNVGDFNSFIESINGDPNNFGPKIVLLGRLYEEMSRRPPDERLQIIQYIRGDIDTPNLADEDIVLVDMLKNGIGDRIVYTPFIAPAPDVIADGKDTIDFDTMRRYV